ncbi:hypothetical protein HT136_01455 [Novosphingobium profundi]|uniref:hypothetical protein n=1 Tax=Novosphingobium profundi TaxID=1774954 RepID=UPI001BDAF060|nr:hypothetical protein [Novosphingobium profundi]MBT0667033.1 hypothetical protein [Novosphingobium profundi]
MTVPVKVPQAQYDEDGVTLTFATRFRYLDPSDLEVARVEDGSTTVLAPETEWTASDGDSVDGGSVTLKATISGKRLRIRRVTPMRQSTDYLDDDRFPAESHERALDRLTLIAQERDMLLSDLGTKAVRVPEGESIVTVPTVADRKGKVFTWDPATGAPQVTSIGNVYDGTQAIVAETRTIMAGLSGMSEGQSVMLGEEGRKGLFLWSSGDRSSLVDLDAQQGNVVAPATDTTGANGAWLRAYTDAVDVDAFGAKSGSVSSGFDSRAAIQGAFDWSASSGVPRTSRISLTQSDYFISQNDAYPGVAPKPCIIPYPGFKELNGNGATLHIKEGYKGLRYVGTEFGLQTDYAVTADVAYGSYEVTVADATGLQIGTKGWIQLGDMLLSTGDTAEPEWIDYVRIVDITGNVLRFNKPINYNFIQSDANNDTNFFFRVVPTFEDITIRDIHFRPETSTLNQAMRLVYSAGGRFINLTSKNISNPFTLQYAINPEFVGGRVEYTQVQNVTGDGRGLNLLEARGGLVRNMEFVGCYAGLGGEGRAQIITENCTFVVPWTRDELRALQAAAGATQGQFLVDGADPGGSTVHRNMTIRGKSGWILGTAPGGAATPSKYMGDFTVCGLDAAYAGTPRQIRMWQVRDWIRLPDTSGGQVVEHYDINNAAWYEYDFPLADGLTEDVALPAGVLVDAEVLVPAGVTIGATGTEQITNIFLGRGAGATNIPYNFRTFTGITPGSWCAFRIAQGNTADNTRDFWEMRTTYLKWRIVTLAAGGLTPDKVLKLRAKVALRQQVNLGGDNTSPDHLVRVATAATKYTRPGNVVAMTYSQTIDIANVAAGGSVTVTVTMPGAIVGSTAITAFNKTGGLGGLIVADAYCDAAGAGKVVLTNPTAAAIDPASATCLVSYQILRRALA